MWLDKFKTAIEDESNIMWFVCKNQTHETELNMIRNAKNLFHNWAIGKERKSSIYQKDIVSTMITVNKETMLNEKGKYTSDKSMKQVKTCEKIEYLNIPVGGDTEVNPPIFNPIQREDVAIPYLWQIFIIDTTVCGFYLEDFEKFLGLFSAYHDLSYNKRFVIYYHNLAYDLSFFKKFFKWEDCFNVGMLKPTRWLTKNGIEFRDSLVLTGLSLEESAKEKCTYNVNKLTDIMDYNKFHFVGEEIDENTLKYSIQDVKVLSAIVQNYIEEYGDIAHIPYTLTGEVRRYLKKNCLAREFEGNKFNGLDFRKVMKESTLTSEEFNLARDAFQGGLVRANKYFVGQTIHDKLTHIDLSSAYVSKICSQRFPLGKGVKIEVKNVDEMISLIKQDKFAFLIEFGALNVRLKPQYSQITTLPEGKCWIVGDVDCVDREYEKKVTINGKKVYAKNKVVNDNGSIVFADYIGTVMTELDFYLFNEMYTCDEIEIMRVYRYELHYLPRPIVLTCLELYKKKTELKGKKDRMSQILYAKYKSMLNSIYGMFCYNFTKDTAEYDALNDEWYYKEHNLDACLEEENNRKTRTTSYLIGVWTTAYVRYSIIKSVIACGNDWKYSDTDCNITSNYYEHKEWFDNYNEYMKEDLKIVCDKYGIDYDSYCEPKNVDGIKFPLGAWSVEDKYILFKTQGAKRYMTVNKYGEYKITIAGCSKTYREDGKVKTVADYWHKKNGTIWKAFEEFENYNSATKSGFYIDEEHSGKLTHSYFNNTRKCCVFVDGRMVEYNVQSGCILKPTSFKLGIEDFYKKLILCLAGLEDSVDFNNENYFVPYTTDSPLAKFFK